MILKFNADNSALEGTSQLVITIELNPEATNMTKSKLLFTSHRMANTLCVQTTDEQTHQNSLHFYRAINKETYDSSIHHGSIWNRVHTINCENQISCLKIARNELSFRSQVATNVNNETKTQQDYKQFLVASYNDGQTGFIDMNSFGQVFLSALPGNRLSPVKQEFEAKKLY